MTQNQREAAVALLPWGLALEDFFEPHGLTLDSFCREFRGSWMFGYVEALRFAGVHTVIVAVSAGQREIERRVHEPSGADVLALPAPRVFRALRRRMTNPYGRTAGATFGLDGSKRLLWPLAALATQAAPYLSTPRRALGKALVNVGCTAILCQEYEFPRFDAAARISRWTGIPLFATFQGGDYRRWRLESLVRPRSMKRCLGFVVASSAEARRLVDVYGLPADRIHAIPNPVDVSFWQPGDRDAARQRLSLSAGERIVVWHGRIHVWKKGLDVLLDAWERLQAVQVSACRLVLVGDGPDTDVLSARIGRATNVTFVNRLVHDAAKLRDYLVAADVYVFPSRHEGFAIAPVEAMACGLPLVAADASGVAEMLPEAERSGGIVVSREDPLGLSRALGSLLADPVLSRTLGERARRRAVEAFSYEAVGRQLASVLAA